VFEKISEGNMSPCPTGDNVIVNEPHCDGEDHLFRSFP